MDFLKKKLNFTLWMPAEGRKTRKTTLAVITEEPRVFNIFQRFFQGVFIMPRAISPHLNEFHSTNIFKIVAGQSLAIFLFFLF